MKPKNNVSLSIVILVCLIAVVISLRPQPADSETPNKTYNPPLPKNGMVKYDSYFIYAYVLNKRTYYIIGENIKLTNPTDTQIDAELGDGLTLHIQKQGKHLVRLVNINGIAEISIDATRFRTVKEFLSEIKRQQKR